MKVIEVNITPGSGLNKVTIEGNKYKVHVRAPAIDGKANKALIDLLVIYLNVKKSNVEILRGETSRKKLLRIS